MRTIQNTLLLLVCLATGTLFAQSQVSASKILADINAGKDINLQNVTITGDLDFINLDNRQEERGNGWSKQQTYLVEIETDVVFVNCVFEGKVLGYFSDNKDWGNSNKLINVNFDQAATFKNCTFKEDAHFKYSRFGQGADFSGSQFKEEALFKYTEFDGLASYANATFDGEANFKYTEFDGLADFSSAIFGGDADFKYTEFDDALKMSNAVFKRDADFKYTEFPKGSELNNVDFGRRADFKYATLGGREYRGGR